MLIVFDLDGTLLDTLPDIAAALNETLRAEGLPEQPLEAFPGIVGDGARIAVRRATSGRLDKPGIDRVTERYLDVYRRRGSPETRPYEGIIETLEALTHAGHALAVLTNKPHDIAQRVMREQLGGFEFAAIEGVREGWARKPDPAGLLRIIKSAGFERARAVYAGDTNTDMRTGRAAGVWTIGCAWGFRGAEELRESGADVVIESPTRLAGAVAAGGGLPLTDPGYTEDEPRA